MKFSDVELPSNRKFGFFFAGIFALAGAYFLYENAFNLALTFSLTGVYSLYEKASNLALTFFCIAVVFVVVTLTKAELLLPLNKLWIRLGLLLGMVVSPIVLGIMFFVLFTPIGLLMRLFGRDELRLKLKPRVSYWKVREPSSLTDNSFKHQF